MAGWITIDNFETGSLSGDWTGNTSNWNVDSSDPIDGTYSAWMDATGPNRMWNTSVTVSKNSGTDPTVRMLLNDSDADSKNSVTQDWLGLAFCVQDANNMYEFRVNVNSSGNTYYALYKLVGGTLTSLSSGNVGGIAKAVMISARDSIIYYYIYSDTSYTTQIVGAGFAGDTSFSSGYVGVTGGTYSPRTPNPTVDNIEYYDSGSTPTAWAHKIYGIVPRYIMSVNTSSITSVIGVTK